MKTKAIKNSKEIKKAKTEEQIIQDFFASIRQAFRGNIYKY